MRKVIYSLAFLFIYSPGWLARVGGEISIGNEVILVIGAAGEDQYGEEFNQSLALWRQACEAGKADWFIIGEIEGDEPDYDILQKRLSEVEREGSTPLWIVLIGHGTFDGRLTKFNLRGKDVSAEDLKQWLDPIKRPVAVINAASASARPPTRWRTG